MLNSFLVDGKKQPPKKVFSKVISSVSNCGLGTIPYVFCHGLLPITTNPHKFSTSIDTVIIVEGEDDISFFNGKFSSNVDIRESFSGKRGVLEIVSFFSDNSQIRTLNPRLTGYIRYQVDQVHIEYIKKHSLPELLSITQGHDFLDYFRELCLTTWSPSSKFPSSRELFRALVASFRQDDFEQTILYQQLNDYQDKYHFSIFPA